MIFTTKKIISKISLLFLLILFSSISANEDQAFMDAARAVLKNDSYRAENYASTSSTNPAPINTISTTSADGSYINHPKLSKLINKMSHTHGFNRDYLTSLFHNIQRDEDILRRVNSPAEKKAWHQYRRIFMTEERVTKGVQFWKKHKVTLERASKEYGVPSEYIVAIIGVESLYGKRTGKHFLLPSLTTLAIDFPKRSRFYTSELSQFLLLSREEGLNPRQIKGSYAGAMGLGQFISSSYRHYSIDFNNDGRRDLWNPQDAIGSIARYLNKNGWKKNQDIATPARFNRKFNFNQYVTVKARKPKLSLSQLSNVGIHPLTALSTTKYDLLYLNGQNGDEYWVTGNNFYAITRYNHSPKYAMAVHHLAKSIAQLNKP